jgi:hypothetical protein
LIRTKTLFVQKLDSNKLACAAAAAAKNCCLKSKKKINKIQFMVDDKFMVKSSVFSIM